MRLKDIDDSAYETWTEERETYKKVKYKRTYQNANERRDAFHASAAWQELRARVLDHYGRKCLRCGKTSGPIQVDHIKPRSLYPELRLEFRNMQVLCHACNMEKGQTTEDYRSRLDKFKFPLP